MATSDNFALGLRLIVLVATGLAILLSAGYIQNVNAQTGEYYTLLLLCAAGMMAMGSATDLIVVFLALEVFSLGLYILCGLNRREPRSSEAAMKYFLLGAFASSFFVYGAALIYGAAGSTKYALPCCLSDLASRSAWFHSTCGRRMSIRAPLHR
jgi:NADH-quinone oxidoreductase subunit N